MVRDVVDLGEVDRSDVELVGAKAATLAELARLDGVSVPSGWCVTTEAFRRVLATTPAIGDALDDLAGLGPDDDEVGGASAALRRLVAQCDVPAEVETAVHDALARSGEDTAWAVRSSATTEDLPTASFAGQHDSFLGVVGPAAVLDHVRRCWASLFTERAVRYRLRHGIDHRDALMGVLVQRLVDADAAGVVFTADPVSGHRGVVVVEGRLGLAADLVSGTVTPDTWTVQAGAVRNRVVREKASALRPGPDGGTRRQPVAPDRRDQAALTDEQVLRLVDLARRIEAHLGNPQDVEWALADDAFHVVQARPITTLFPPPAVDDDRTHVYISVGHQQMMTDAMRPLGLSLWRLTSPAPMVEAGNRLFVDVTTPLAAPASRAGLMAMADRSDPLIGDALATVVDRPDIVPPPEPDDQAAGGATDERPGAGRAQRPDEPISTDPAIVTDLVAKWEVSQRDMEAELARLSGTAAVDFILADVPRLRALMFDPTSSRATMAGMEATWWLNDHLEEWLGERNPADALTLSVDHNITSRMGLELLDVADAIRPHPEVVAFLRTVEDDGFLAELPRLPGGREAADAIAAWLEVHGVRCVGEIDVTRPRFRERPSMLVPMILANLDNFAAGEATRRFDRGREEAQRAAHELLARLRAGPDGVDRAEQVADMVERLRTFIGYREYPKYGMVRRWFAYKQALLAEARRLVASGVLAAVDDIDFLTLPELRDVVDAGRVDPDLVRRRRDAHRAARSLTPPRVLTSDGEGFHGAYRRDDVPDGSLVGLPVSSGVVEGTARVVTSMADADLRAGDVLVTRFTDPSWTPAFVAIAGLVTEVGGLMTHGAVVAREYGLPAVVGVEDATSAIRDGQRIRVDGTHGWVELLS